MKKQQSWNDDSKVDGSEENAEKIKYNGSLI
jgi:hypothetical protein